MEVHSWAAFPHSTPVKMHHAELWSVCVKRVVKPDCEEYRVNVGDNMTRIFDVTTLPDTIKEKLAMVHAFGIDESIDTPQSAAWEIILPKHYPPDFINIGWFLTKSKVNNVYYYQVMLTFDELCAIRGVEVLVRDHRITRESA